MITICDFNDSFTYNIYTEIKRLYPLIDVEVVEFDQILKKLKWLKSQRGKHILILGPGPGHPDEYKIFFRDINKLFSKSNIFIFGICLGHQILCQLLGAEVKRSKLPVHGQKVTYEKRKNLSIPGISFPLEVQRYNSLAVKSSIKIVELFKQKNIKFYIESDEIIVTYGDHFITYQFHPESVGTTCPESYFRIIGKFLL